MNCTTPTCMPWPRARATMPKADELFPLPLPVRTSSTPRRSVAAAMRASTAAFLRCMRARWRASGSSPGCRSSLPLTLMRPPAKINGGCTAPSARVLRRGGVRAMGKRDVQQRREPHIHAWDHQEARVPAREVRPPAEEIRVLDATSQPVEAPVGEQVADRNGTHQAREQPGKIERNLLIMSAQPGTPQPQHRVRRYDEPVGEGHAVVADAVVADGEAVDGYGVDEQRPECPAPFAPEVEAAEEEHGPGGVGRQPHAAYVPKTRRGHRQRQQSEQCEPSRIWRKHG